MTTLNDQDYSPIDHLNQIFGPSSSNLTRLSEVTDNVQLYSASLDRELAKSVRLSDEERSALERIDDLPKEFAYLVDKIQQLKTQSGEAEQAITAMTADIKRLDRTKANLVYSVTVLKRLQMLITAYDQLEGLTRSRQYRELSRTLPAVLELMTHFRSFRSVSQIAALSRQVSNIQSTIAEQIMADFATVIEGKQRNEQLGASLADACTVLDSLDGNYRDQLITWYCNVQLREYGNIFKVNDEAGSLDNISRRYAYIKRLLKRHSDDLARYFSPDWNVTEELCNAVCQTTRQDLQTLLRQSGRNITVQLLLQALEETLEFENFLDKKFKSPGKYQKKISLAFQPHLNLWVEYQDKQLSSKFAQFKAPPPPGGDNNEEQTEPTVLPSSADLFVIYRQALTQTVKLSTGPPLLDLSNLFGKWLSIYCQQILRPVIPTRVVTLDDIKSACMALNTADYCFTTVTQLEQRIVENIDEELKEKVDLEKEKNGFLEAISHAIALLVNKVQSGCENAWREMVNTNWGKLETVGDQSTYVSELTRAVEAESKTILEHIQKGLYVRMFADKVVEAVSGDFLQRIAYCRPISEVAAEQMLLDLYVLKSSFMKLPLLAPPPEGEDHPREVSPAYTRHVTNALSRVETILKVILTQLEPAEGIVQTYFYVVGDRSSTNFTKILELKGVSKNEQTGLVELFNSHLKAHTDLVDESPILRNLRIGNQNGPSGHSRTPSNQGSPTPSFFEPPKVLGGSLLSKEGFERFTHHPDAPVNKLNENFKSIGRLFRRDGSGHSSPLGRLRDRDRDRDRD